LRSCVSLLNSLLSSIIDPGSCYLTGLVIPPAAYHEEGFYRAFNQRLESVDIALWPTTGFRKQPFEVLLSHLPIPTQLSPPTTPLDIPSSGTTASTSIIHVQNRPTEVMLGGVKMGSRFPPTSKGASYLCRARIADDFMKIIAGGVQPVNTQRASVVRTYADMKQKVGANVRIVKRSVYEALGGWVTNDGDTEFALHASTPNVV
jgi:hypothetical protein